MESSFLKSFRNKLNTFEDDLFLNPNRALSLDSKSATELLKFLVESACQAQSFEANKLGSNYLLELPRDWLLKRIQSVVSVQLDLNDDCEYELLLDLYTLLKDEGLLNNLIELGLKSESLYIQEIAEIAKVGKYDPLSPDELNKRHRSWMNGRPEWRSNENR